MNSVIIVCGNWFFENNRWLFHLDNKRGSKLIAANEKTSFEEFLKMVYEDFEIDERVYNVGLSYMLPKKQLMKLSLDTPPVKVGNSRQFHGFLGLLNSEKVRLCVEVREREIINPPQKFEQAEEVNHDGTDENSDGELDRFDYCDDSDGTSSGDEDFVRYGIPNGEENERQKPPLKKQQTYHQQKGFNPYVKMDLSSLNIEFGQNYESKDALETRLKILIVIQKFDFNVDRSTPKLLEVKCWVPGCRWKVRASPIGDSLHFTVRGYVAQHSCSVTERSARCRQATPAILGLLYKDFIGGVDQTVLPNHVAQALNKSFGIKIDYWKAHRTLKVARDLIMGSSESGYEDLPVYLHMIRRANPGTLTRLEVDDKNRFKYLFLAFGASISGFQFMRKVVVVDGTFLQGKYKGTLLIASSQDGNFQIFPIAFAVVDTENDDSWKWFFRQLNIIIPDNEGLAIISDRHKSIRNAIDEVYPMSTRGICTYHLYKNILVRFRGGDLFRLVKRAANAFRLSNTFEEIKALNPALHAYLEKADVKTWTRVHFPGERYNFTTTNIAESLNRALSNARNLPVVHLLEAIRLMLTRWFATRKDDAEKMNTTLTRGVEKLLEGRITHAKLLTVQAIDVHQVQVVGVSTIHVVNLTERTCSCRRFDIEKIPCIHAIAAAEARKISRISLCHQYYRKSFLVNAWHSVVMPKDFAIPVPEHVRARKCLPPVVRQSPGRPRNSRIKSVLEKGIGTKRPRKEHTCSICNLKGHNRMTCPLK